MKLAYIKMLKFQLGMCSIKRSDLGQEDRKREDALQ